MLRPPLATNRRGGGERERERQRDEESNGKKKHEKMKAKEHTEKRVEEEMTWEKKAKRASNSVDRVEKSHKKRQKFKKLNWWPNPKQSGLFSDRDPSQETQLENRLNRLSKLLADIAQHVRKHHVKKVCYAGLWLGLLLQSQYVWGAMTLHTGLEDRPVWVCLLDILQALGEVVLIVLCFVPNDFISRIKAQ